MILSWSTCELDTALREQYLFRPRRHVREMPRRPEGYLADHAPRMRAAGAFQPTRPRHAAARRIRMNALAPNRCAQSQISPPWMIRHRRAGFHEWVIRSYVFEFLAEIDVMKFSPTRAPTRPHEPRTALARYSSTTLSTMTVDKQENHHCVTDLSRFSARPDNKLP
jgi:hypothetical protein